MKQRHLAQIFLSLLLIAQLAVGAFANAHTSDSPAVATRMEQGDRCAGHHHVDGSGQPAPPAGTDCCTQSVCSCSCAVSPAVSVTPLRSIPTVAARLLVIDLAAAPVAVGRVFELLRPPI